MDNLVFSHFLNACVSAPVRIDLLVEYEQVLQPQCGRYSGDSRARRERRKYIEKVKSTDFRTLRIGFCRQFCRQKMEYDLLDESFSAKNK